jgi:hypothetical protein
VYSVLVRRVGFDANDAWMLDRVPGNKRESKISLVRHSARATSAQLEADPGLLRNDVERSDFERQLRQSPISFPNDRIAPLKQGVDAEVSAGVPQLLGGELLATLEAGPQIGIRVRHCVSIIGLWTKLNV